MKISLTLKTTKYCYIGMTPGIPEAKEKPVKDKKSKKQRKKVRQCLNFLTIQSH